MQRWSKGEIEKLIKLYPIKTNKELIKEFNGRSFESIYKKAMALSIKRNKEIEFVNRSTGREWTHNKQKNYKGYVLVYRKGHHRADKYGRVFEHIVVWEDFNNTKIPDGHIIHHINGIKDDNRIENLKLMTISEHSIFHNSQREISNKTRLKISKANKGKTAKEKHYLYKNIDISKMKELIREGNSTTSVCRMFNIDTSTYYRKLKEINK